MLVDFNISKVWSNRKGDKSKTTFLTQISTPLHAAPEVIMGSGYTEAIDVWGIGLIGYLLLGGSIDSLDMHTVSKTQRCKKFQEFVQKSSLVSDQMKAFIHQCLEENPDERIRSSDCCFSFPTELADSY